MFKHVLKLVFLFLSIQHGVNAQDAVLHDGGAAEKYYVVEEVGASGNPWSMPGYQSMPAPRQTDGIQQRSPRYVTPEELKALETLPETNMRGMYGQESSRYITPGEMEALNKLPAEQQRYSPYRSPMWGGVYPGTGVYQNPYLGGMPLVNPYYGYGLPYMY